MTERSGREWTREEDEQLRVLWAEVVRQMPSRSEAAIAARLARLRHLEYRNNWPHNPLTS